MQRAFVPPLMGAGSVSRNIAQGAGPAAGTTSTKSGKRAASSRTTSAPARDESSTDSSCPPEGHIINPGSQAVSSIIGCVAAGVTTQILESTLPAVREARMNNPDGLLCNAVGVVSAGSAILASSRASSIASRWADKLSFNVGPGIKGQVASTGINIIVTLVAYGAARKLASFLFGPPITSRREMYEDEEGPAGNERTIAHECVVCMEQPQSVLYIPCRHAAVCESCNEGLDLKQCPVCRQQIQQAISIIHP
eukprot:tig00020563_g11268.t1